MQQGSAWPAIPDSEAADGAGVPGRGNGAATGTGRVGTSDWGVMQQKMHERIHGEVPDCPEPPPILWQLPPAAMPHEPLFLTAPGAPPFFGRPCLQAGSGAISHLDGAQQAAMEELQWPRSAPKVREQHWHLRHVPACLLRACVPYQARNASPASCR